MTNDLSKHPIHLGLGATAVRQPEFTGDMQWYEAYSDRCAQDGVEGRLVAMHSFDKPWDMWEMHPQGSEVVLCTAGELVIIQDIGGEHVRTTLGPGQYAINEPGTWHTADIETSATAVFITAGLGTQHKPR